VELFSNTQADAAGTSPVDPTVFQGRTLVGTGTVVGSGPVILEIPLAAAAVGDWLTATATAVDGSTSPFSAAAQVAQSITLAVAVTPPAVGRYRVGDVLTFAVDFAVPVFVTGVPALPLTIGQASLQAAYAGGSGTTSLLFRHTVQPGEEGGVLIGSLFAFAGGGATISASTSRTKCPLRTPRASSSTGLPGWCSPRPRPAPRWPGIASSSTAS